MLAYIRVALVVAAFVSAVAAEEKPPARIVGFVNQDFNPGAAELGERGFINTGVYKILEILGPSEMRIYQHWASYSGPAGGRITGSDVREWQFIMKGMPTKELVTDRWISLNRQPFRATGTKTIGSRKLIVIEPDPDLAKEVATREAEDQAAKGKAKAVAEARDKAKAVAEAQA